MNPEDRLIIALDESEVVEALRTANLFKNIDAIMKIGLTTFSAGGPDIVRAISKLGKRIFLDLKLFDIPEQVVGAVRGLTRLSAHMITLHTLGGIEMMTAAKKAVLEESNYIGARRPTLLGVTILTSLDDVWLKKLSMSGTNEIVPALAQAAQEAGLDGVVASAHEVTKIKSLCGRDFVVVVPGIRLSDTRKDDQKRIASPENALAAGADYLVIGRPITGAADPHAAAAEILERMRRSQ